MWTSIKRFSFVTSRFCRRLKNHSKHSMLGHSQNKWTYYLRNIVVVISKSARLTVKVFHYYLMKSPTCCMSFFYKLVGVSHCFMSSQWKYMWNTWLYHTFSKLVKKLNDASLCKRSLALELARGPSRGLNALGCGHFLKLSLSQVNFIEHTGDHTPCLEWIELIEMCFHAKFGLNSVRVMALSSFALKNGCFDWFFKNRFLWGPFWKKYFGKITLNLFIKGSKIACFFTKKLSNSINWAYLSVLGIFIHSVKYMFVRLMEKTIILSSLWV
jgi:hypothetical protein